MTASPYDTRAHIDTILKHEGSAFTNHPRDRGGPTKYGITQKTLAAWRSRAVSVRDVRTLTEQEARDIYENLYISRPGFDRIHDARVQGLVIDCGVHVGTATATRWLQKAAGVKVDGCVGPVTLRAVNSGKPEALYKKVLAARLRHYGRIITDNPSQSAFAAGWLNRAATFVIG